MRKILRLALAIELASRTLSNLRNLCRMKPCVQKLPAIRLPQVDPQLQSSVLCRAHTEQFGAIGKFSRKFRFYLFADGIAAGSDARSDAGEQIARPRTELPSHLFDAVFNNPGGGPPPSCMKRSNSTSYAIDQQNRAAVRRSDSEKNPCIRCHQSI